jgi:hypothetical protein
VIGTPATRPSKRVGTASSQSARLLRGGTRRSPRALLTWVHHCGDCAARGTEGTSVSTDSTFSLVA